VSEGVVVGLEVQVLGLQDHAVTVEYQNFQTFRRSRGRNRNRERFLGGEGSSSDGSEAKSGDVAERVRRRSKKVWGRREPYRARHGRLAVWLWALPVVLTDLTTDRYEPLNMVCFFFFLFFFFYHKTLKFIFTTKIRK
jgi:hypothetical protein